MKQDSPPLWLLPGFLCDGRLWAAQLAGLADIASPRVADLSGADSVAAMAQAVLAQAPARFALAGLSMGGYVALEIMRQAPERIARLALIDTSARPDSAAQRARRQDQLDHVRGGGFAAAVEELLPPLVHPDRLQDDAVAGVYRRMAHGLGADVFLRQLTAILNRPDSRPGLPRIACPTLVLCGRQDARTPLELHEEMARAIPEARLVVVEDCGHLSTLERPDSVTAEMRRWLDASVSVA